MEALFCALLRSFALLCPLSNLRSVALCCALLRSFVCFCIRPRLERRRLGTGDSQARIWGVSLKTVSRDSFHTRRPKWIAKGGVRKRNKGGCKRLLAFVHVCLRLFASSPLRLRAFCQRLCAFARFCLRPLCCVPLCVPPKGPLASPTSFRKVFR